MKDSLTLTEIANALDTLTDITVSDRSDELAGHNATFWRSLVSQLGQLESGQRHYRLEREEDEGGRPLRPTRKRS